LSVKEFRPTDCKTLNVGLLFIIIDDFPNEILWRLWAGQHLSSFEKEKEEGEGEGERVKSRDSTTDNYQGSPVRFWFHAKYPDRVRSAWVRRRLVRGFHLQPSWGSVEITRVMVEMLHEVRLKICVRTRSVAVARGMC
jgi:hypothetical protein